MIRRCSPNWTAIISIPLGIVFGVVADKLNFRKWMIAAGYLLVTVCVAFFYFSPGTDMTPVPGSRVSLWACAVRLSPHWDEGHYPSACPRTEKTDFVLATMAFHSHGGLLKLLADTSFPLVSSIGWQANAQFVLAPLALCAALCGDPFLSSPTKR